VGGKKGVTLEGKGNGHVPDNNEKKIKKKERGKA